MCVYTAAHANGKAKQKSQRENRVYNIKLNEINYAIPPIPAAEPATTWIIYIFIFIFTLGLTLFLHLLHTYTQIAMLNHMKKLRQFNIIANLFVYVLSVKFDDLS